VCRHLAYVGRRVKAADLLLDSPHGLVSQVDHPRCQLPGITNRDGWGIAWCKGSTWDRHRSTIPLSVDRDGHARLRAIESPAIVAAVRRASPGLALVESGNAPFLSGTWAFSHNGFVGGYATGSHDPLVDQLTPSRRDALVGDTDSEALFGLVLDRLDEGAAPEVALSEVVQLGLEAAGVEPSRLNLLLSDGSTVWATRWSNSLFQRRTAEGDAVVASEPYDEDPSWVEVPDASVVTATAAGVSVMPLA
jgi:glutamine amidotransferase